MLRVGSQAMEPGQSPSTTGTPIWENMKAMQPDNPESKSEDSNSGYIVNKT